MDREHGQLVPHLDREINGTYYRARQLKISKWADLTEHLAEMLGKPFGQALRGGTVDLDALLGQDTVVALLALVTERLTARNLLKLLGFAGESLQMEADNEVGFTTWKPGQWDSHFRCHMGNLAPVILLFLEAQYADFFGGLKALVPEHKNGPQDPRQKEDPDSTKSPST